MSSQPNLVKATDGQVWLLHGFKIFKKQPFIWILSLFTYWIAMFLFGLIPVFGLIFSLIISPGIAFGFIALAHAIDKGENPIPKLIISGFIGKHAKSMLLLGLIYIAAIAFILLFSISIDKGSLFNTLKIVEFPELTSDSESESSRIGTILAVIIYIPVMMSFWFAPQLVVWNQFSATKAVFYSFFAVWLNKKSFFLYGATWLTIILIFVILMSFLINLFSESRQIIALTIMPSSLIFLAIAHGSYYSSTKSVFMNLNKDDNTLID